MEEPIVCTLNPAEMRGRRARVDALAAAALLSREPIEGGLRHRFRAHDDVEREVRELAALESRCWPSSPSRSPATRTPSCWT